MLTEKRNISKELIAMSLDETLRFHKQTKQSVENVKIERYLSVERAIECKIKYFIGI